jgi:3-methyladenine DNA glycosylase/8-oxoguanine DNA glycosylase
MSSSSASSDAFRLSAPAGFDFWRTAFSHGWCALPPFWHDPARRELGRIFMLRGGVTASCTIAGGTQGVRVKAAWSRSPDRGVRAELADQIRTCLRMGEDFTEFYTEARRHARYRWIAASGAGRMLRSPSMFEDALKMICTTNCTWGLTTLMVSNLVASTGRRHPGGGQAFPSPAEVAGLTESFLRKHVKAGYRSPYILSLAERVASGGLNIESWRTSPLPTAALFDEMRTVKGIGPYAAGNLLKLTGRYEYLGLDSWVRAQYYRLRRRGRPVKDSTLERDYEKFGKWRGLFLWLEMTRDWHGDKFPEQGSAKLSEGTRV